MPLSRAAKPQPKVSSPRCEQRREDILAAATRLFAENGYAATDLQVLADELGVGKGTVYRHFGTKQELFLAVADRVMFQLREHVDAAITDVDDPLDRICRGIYAYLDYFDQWPEAIEIFIQERAQFRDRKRPTYFEHREANIGRWRDMYRDLIAGGRVRAIPVERITDVIGDLLYGAMFVRHIAGRQTPSEQLAENIIDIVFHGILTEPERQARARTARPPKR